MNGLMRRNSFFDDFFTKDLFDFNTGFSQNERTLPSVNVRDLKDGFEIQMAAPGMRKEDFQIGLERNILTISSESETQNEQQDEQGKFTRREFNYSSFKRSFTLPETVEQEKIEASYTDGILKIIVPKKEVSTQMMKTIEIK